MAYRKKLKSCKINCITRGASLGGAEIRCVIARADFDKKFNLALNYEGNNILRGLLRSNYGGARRAHNFIHKFSWLARGESPHVGALTN